VNNVRQTEIQKGEPLVPEPSAFEVEMATEELKRHKSPGTDQIPAGGRKIHSEIHKFITSIWNKVELPEQWTELITVPFIRRAIKKTAVIIGAYHFLPTAYKIVSNILLPRLTSICRGNS